MKRIGFLYDKMLDRQFIADCFDKAAQGKKKKYRIRKYLAHKDKCVDKVYEVLKNRNVEFGKVVNIQIQDRSCGKTRDISIPSFSPDQIIHWCVVSVLKPILKRGMYQYTCGSVDGRGGIYAKKYVEKITLNNKAKYVMKLDIKKFFPSISNKKLKELLAEKIKDKDMLTLLYSIIDLGGTGLPIGFFTSQWLSNFYLQEFDHYVKEQLRIKYYVRYVDDLVLMDNNKRKLKTAMAKLQEFFDNNNYELHIKDNWQLWKSGTRPIDFVGFRFYNGYTRLRKKIFFRLMTAVHKIKASKTCSAKIAMRVSSYLGWLSHINARSLYLQHIKPIISKWKLSYIISKQMQIKQFA